MSDPYIKVYCSEETKKLFDDFYEKNKGSLGTKANMFRVMVSNLPLLASQSNIKLNDPESNELKEGMSEIESMIANEVMEKLNKIDKMVEAMFINGEINDTEAKIIESKESSNQENNSEYKEGMFFTSNRLGR